MKRYNSLSENLKEKYGCKVYKLALSIGNTCPNRDGSKGFGGCIFCANGSGDFAQSVKFSVSEQIDLAKKTVKSKTKDSKYIAYFQSYTSTYLEPEVIYSKLMEAAENPEIVEISIATRPDCLPDNVLDILSEINGIKPVSAELGLQTKHERTARLINRCYPLSDYENAVENLSSRGIGVVTHVIIGLPGEDKGDVIETVRYLNGAGTQGIKLQLLHVLKGTKLCEMYLNGGFKTLSLPEYVDVLCDCIENLSKDIVVHRLTGDAAKNLLVSPLWSADKKNVLNTINREFEKRGVIQGKLV